MKNGPWRTWLFIAYSDERCLCYQFSLPHLYVSPWKGWENVLFELGTERDKLQFGNRTTYMWDRAAVLEARRATIRTRNCTTAGVQVFGSHRLLFGSTRLLAGADQNFGNTRSTILATNAWDDLSCRYWYCSEIPAQWKKWSWRIMDNSKSVLRACIRLNASWETISFVTLFVLFPPINFYYYIFSWGQTGQWNW